MAGEVKAIVCYHEKKAAPYSLQVSVAHGPPAIPMEAGNGQFTAGTTANVEGVLA